MAGWRRPQRHNRHGGAASERSRACPSAGAPGGAPARGRARRPPPAAHPSWLTTSARCGPGAGPVPGSVSAPRLQSRGSTIYVLASSCYLHWRRQTLIALAGSWASGPQSPALVSCLVGFGCWEFQGPGMPHERGVLHPSRLDSLPASCLARRRRLIRHACPFGVPFLSLERRGRGAPLQWDTFGSHLGHFALAY